MSEINQLKIDLRNKTSMYENQKKLNIELKDEIKELKKESLEKDKIILNLTQKVSQLE
ncbi:MAG: hypothetical protein Q8M44_04705 [bacterium]|nr:hypothetical protein [bacterium]